jgi:hypothetical protein
MAEGALPLPDPSDAYLEALAKAAAILDWPLPRERDDVVCHEGARAVDALLVRVARGRGALDVAVGEALDVLGTGARVLDLGHSCVGDYARERLGIAASTAQKMVRFARKLRERPVLRAAVRAGEVPVRAAEAVLPVAVGDSEAFWVERARRQTVRALLAAVKGGTVAPSDQSADDEKWIRTRAELKPDQRAIVDKALGFAREALCATAPRHELVVGMCEEYLGSHAPSEGAADVLLPDPCEENESLKEWLENESAQWAFLDRPGPVEAPRAHPDSVYDLHLLDAELRRLANLRERWDEVFGHLAMLIRAVDGPRRLGFASFEHYCAERLGMGVRAVAERAALERKLYEVPPLREAMRESRISYEKARLIARHADEASIGDWIERAEQTTCIALRRELQHAEDTRMCARGEFEVWAPRAGAAVIALAFSAARKAAGRWISAGECLTRIAEHFIEVWEPTLERRRTLQRQALERDKGLCTVPWCSKAADHAHHIDFRSRGGSDDLSNLTSLCATHHLQGVHKGRIRVTGTAPDHLVWEVVRDIRRGG